MRGGQQDWETSLPAFAEPLLQYCKTNVLGMPRALNDFSCFGGVMAFLIYSNVIRKEIGGFLITLRVLYSPCI